jgi:glutathione S-transferase
MIFLDPDPDPDPDTQNEIIEADIPKRSTVMHLFLNTTSPYARLARIALEEKRGSDVTGEIVDPWADSPRLLEVNTAARVPTLVTDEGVALTESLLIVMWLESQRAQPSLLGARATDVIAKAGVAMGVIDAAVHTLIGRKVTDASFDEAPVGLRRRRSMVNGLLRLEGSPPTYDGATPDLACIATVCALQYVHFRFPQAPWMPSLPNLDALVAALRTRPSFERSQPRL